MVEKVSDLFVMPIAIRDAFLHIVNNTQKAERRQPDRPELLSWDVDVRNANESHSDKCGHLRALTKIKCLDLTRDVCWPHDSVLHDRI
jgi:hypothetical protein